MKDLSKNLDIMKTKKKELYKEKLVKRELQIKKISFYSTAMFKRKM